MTIQPKTKIGRYQILELIGKGGMAEVYKARHVDLDVDVAIKFIRMGRFPQDILRSVVKRFRNEAKKMAQLSHSNIVKVTDYGNYKGIPFLVMEYLPGGTLKKYLGKPMPYQQAARLLLPVADALAFAHSKGVIHRDVKPGNILLSETGQLMLSDFGVAKMIDSEETQGLTATGAAIGTPEYMAPEQALGKKIDHRVDIYSLGVILYELVTGRRPFTADTPMEVVVKQMRDPLPPPSNFVTNLPQDVEWVLHKALEKEPTNRFTDMGAFAQAMEGLTTGVRPAGTARKKSVVKKRTTRTHQKGHAVPSEKKAQVQQARQTVKKKSFDMRWLSGAMVVVGVGLVIFSGLNMFGNARSKPISEEDVLLSQTEIDTTIETTAPEITNTPQFSPTPTLTVSPTPSGPFEYEVLEFDSCWSIAEKFEVDLQTLLAINNFKDGTCPIYPGLKIKVPARWQTLPTHISVPPDLATGTRVNYTVQVGDSIASIADQFNSTVEDILAINKDKFDDENNIPMGVVLVIRVNLVTPTPTFSPTSTLSS